MWHKKRKVLVITIYTTFNNFCENFTCLTPLFLYIYIYFNKRAGLIKFPIWKNTLLIVLFLIKHSSAEVVIYAIHIYIYIYIYIYILWLWLVHIDDYFDLMLLYTIDWVFFYLSSPNWIYIYIYIMSMIGLYWWLFWSDVTLHNWLSFFYLSSPNWKYWWMNLYF